MAQRMAKYFIVTAIFCFLAGCMEGIMFPTKFSLQLFYETVMHIPPEHLKTFFGHFVTKIHTHVHLVGWVSSALMGILYFLVPQMQGEERYTKWVCYANFYVHILGLFVFCAGFHLVGLFGINSGFAPGSPGFREATAPFKLFVLFGGFLIMLSALFFAYNMLWTLCARKKMASGTGKKVIV